jgi:phosphopantothenoylcysteine decarboxylase/phosphopantothenate--cysteine ligase
MSNAMHDTSVQVNTDFLENQKISLVCGGGIASIEAPKLARELRRHGSSVQFFVTETCLKFIGIESLRWASQNEVIINPSGLAEHICTSDAVVVAPATADLISKVAHGICSDGATTLIQSALGLKKTVIFCPTMHESMSASPILQQNQKKLQDTPHIYFLNARKEEGKEKLQNPNLLAMNISHIINKNRLHKKTRKVLLTLGGSRVMIDPVRCITNLSTGDLGFEVLKVFYAMGVETTVLAATTMREVPNYELSKRYFLPDYQDFLHFMKDMDLSSYDGLIHLLAASDFSPAQTEKDKITSSQNEISIKLVKTQKIIDEINLQNLTYKAAAKLTSATDHDGIIQAKSMLNKYKLNAIFWNSTENAWNLEKPHSGVFIEKIENKSFEKNMLGKNDVAKHFYYSFIKSV